MFSLAANKVPLWFIKNCGPRPRPLISKAFVASQFSPSSSER